MTWLLILAPSATAALFDEERVGRGRFDRQLYAV